jgi:diacylglycerol kinase (ATP)
VSETRIKQSGKLNGTGLMRIFKAIHCSVKGFKAAYKFESAFRQELLLCIALFPISFIISTTLMEWLFLLCSLIFLLFAEILNSAIEALADRISLEHHELLGRAKDLGSAGVFLAILVVFLVWSVVFFKFII